MSLSAPFHLTQMLRSSPFAHLNRRSDQSDKSWFSFSFWSSSVHSALFGPKTTALVIAAVLECFQLARPVHNPSIMCKCNADWTKPHSYQTKQKIIESGCGLSKVIRFGTTATESQAILLRMRIGLVVLITASLLLFVSDAIPTSRLFDSVHANGNYLTKQVHWFNQTVNHFSPYDHRQFGQRYYEFLDYFRMPDGPIFLKICGEASCNGIVNDYISVLAKKFGAAVVSLEHRYYGKSSPFKTHTTNNLQYLSSKQALFDLAAFRQYYQNSINVRLNKSEVENSWFVFGISYPGALSAWFRLKFPHLTCGSLASSAVVQAIYNFTEFDKQIGVSAGSDCKAALQEINGLVEKRLTSDGPKLKELFGASELKIDGDFLYFLADAAVIAFQYGNPDTLCSPIVKAKESGEDMLDAYAKYVKEYYLKKFGVSVHTYNQQYLKDTSTNGETADRLWWFQVCSEVAYFQVAPSSDNIRSSKVDARYHMDLCKNVFGEGVYPDVEATNIYYGGTKIAGSKIIFANGSQDPWRHATKQTSSTDIPSYLITCHNCGHGVDMRGCPQSPLSLEGNAQNCSSQEAVHIVREQIVENIDLWLSECQNTGWTSI